MSVSNFLLSTHNPDVLTCIANLSNDEVFTPPEMAAAMLDLAAEAWARDHDGENLWANPNARVLDPFVKTGVFLREATRRFNEGLISVIPDHQERVNHILTKQIYGIAITELTALMARRSVYCSKYANSEHSICTAFDTPEGNIWFERTEHLWDDKTGRRSAEIDPFTGEEIVVRSGRRCTFCGAGEDDYGRGEDLETHAYAFIHTNDIKQRISEIFGDNMHFDLVIGNPPYQLSDGGFGKSAVPIYHSFVEQAKALDPTYLSMIIPARWFAGGKGLEDFRTAMLNDRGISVLHDYFDSREVFSDVDIAGGVCYFLRSREYSGKARVVTHRGGQTVESLRFLLERELDIFIRDGRALSILEKVVSTTRDSDMPASLVLPEDKSFASLVSGRMPFGLPTNFSGKNSPGSNSPVQVLSSRGLVWADEDAIKIKAVSVDSWKVFTSNASHDHAGQADKNGVRRVLGRTGVLPPNCVVTDSYIVLGSFSSEDEAKNCLSYVKTKFVRFLVALRTSTQHITQSRFLFVPLQTWDRKWTDEALYEKYRLSVEDIAYIESVIRPMEDE